MLVSALDQVCQWLEDRNLYYHHSHFEWCGHNIINFDLPFIRQRCFALRVDQLNLIPQDLKPWSKGVIDTMVMWSGPRDYVSLDNLLHYLRLSHLSKDATGDIYGSMVGQLWAEGEHEMIASYCMADVQRTRQAHKAMSFSLKGED